MLYLTIILFVILLIVAYCYWKPRPNRKFARRRFNLLSILHRHIATPSRNRREQRDNRQVTKQWQNKLHQKEKIISNLKLQVEELSENISRLENEISDLSNENYRYNQLLQSPAILQDVNEFCRENWQLLDLIEKIKIDLREQTTSYPAVDEESELFVKRQICNYFAQINPEQRCRWSHILKTRSYSKHIFDDRLKPSVMAETDPELKQRILRDHLYADVYASAIGALLVTLEHLRNMHLFTRKPYSWKKTQTYT